MIDFALVTAQAKKIQKWKAPGPDGIQGYWIKRLAPLNDRIAEQINEIINSRAAIPAKMTMGRTV